MLHNPEVSLIQVAKIIGVADDDLHNRNILSATFKAMGMQVLEAESGNKAYELILAGHVDLIVSDIRMAEGTGVELLRRMRRLEAERGSAPPVIIMTALLDGGDRYLRALGAKDVLMKPLDLDVVVTAANKAMGLSERP